jgi:serine carboxypeptidase-like clade 2
MLDSTLALKTHILSTGVWFQGGPGCSSMIGFMSENGPLRFADAGGAGGPNAPLEANTLSWSRLMNMVYITGPRCVGFSRAGPGGDCSSSDNTTAVANLEAVEALFATVEPLAKTRLLLLGESYAGSYLFFLSHEILNSGSSSLRARYAGVAVGNPVMSCSQWKVGANDTQVEIYYGHSVIPLHVRNQWFSRCAVGTGGGGTPPCDALMADIVAMVGPQDGDNLYTDTCTGNASLADAASSEGAACTSFQTRRNSYLNDPAVIEALHALTPVSPAGWAACAAADPVYFNYTSSWPDITPFYLEIGAKAPGARILVYSGDVDLATCPFGYTQLCLNEMNLPIINRWRRWLGPNGQTAGYTETYRLDQIALTFASVKGSGHEVPMFAPYPAFVMMQRFLAGEPL